MGKTLKYGSHDFPSSAGFTGSSGGMASIRTHMRKVPTHVNRGGAPKVSPVGVPKAPIAPGAPKLKTLPSQPKIGAVTGGAFTKRSKPVVEADRAMGKSALLPGYKRGGSVKKDAC